MSSGDPLPYNVTLTDQSAIIRFFPHRDGAVDDNWNTTYSDSSFAEWSYDDTFGKGVSSHRTTLVGAYIIIDWAGTAVYIYGSGSKNSYNVTTNQGDAVLGEGNIGGLLFSQTGLEYGLHTVKLAVIEGEVSISGAIITVGMGESGTVLQARNISAASSSSFFDSSQYWPVSTLYTNQTSGGYPCMTTNTLNAALSFTISEAVGFMIYGSDDWQQGLFTVAVTSEQPGAAGSITDNTIQYSPRALWTQLDVPKYLAAGLNRSATYNVEITNLGANFNLASVLIYDALPGATSSMTSSVSSIGAAPSDITGSGNPPGPSRSSAGTSSASISHSNTTMKAVIASVVASCAILALVAIVAVRRMRIKRRLDQQTLKMVGEPRPFDLTQGPFLPPLRQVEPPRILPTEKQKNPIGRIYSSPSSSGVTSSSRPSNPLRSDPNSTSCSPAAGYGLAVRSRSDCDHDKYVSIGSRLHELDAGPVIEPPVYDPTWAQRLSSTIRVRGSLSPSPSQPTRKRSLEA